MFKRGQKLASKLLMLIIFTSMVSTTMEFSGVKNVVYASAATVIAESDFGFDTSTGTITEYYGSGNKLVIPSIINGALVKSIGKNAFDGCNLTSITIPNGVTSIESGAFWRSSSLTSINIPNSVTNIGEYAFESCESLKSINIPNSVTSIGSEAFYGCDGLTSVTIPNGVTSIGDEAFGWCSKLKSVTIPNSVKNIESGTFGWCNNLTSVTIPNSVTSIESSAFINCSSLTSITIPNSVESIGNGAFYGCTNVKFYAKSNTVKQLLINSGADSSKIIVGGQSPIVKVTSISLSKTSLNLVKGKTSIVTATIAPSNATNKDVTWTSSNTKVATVDSSGKVTAVGVGTANIVCTAKDGSKKSATSKVIVINNSIAKVTLNKTSLNVVKGKTSTLTATISPSNATNNPITWKSSNTKVAAVDGNGKIIGVGVGTAIITATTKDGSEKYATCKVTVTNPASVTSVKLSKTTLSLKVGKTSTLTSTITPSNVTNKTVTWKSSSSSIATVDSNGKITAKKVGKVIITCTASDRSKKSATCTVNVTK